jgi:hypothetical protein
MNRQRETDSPSPLLREWVKMVQRIDDFSGCNQLLLLVNAIEWTGDFFGEKRSLYGRAPCFSFIFVPNLFQ